MFKIRRFTYANAGRGGSIINISSIPEVNRSKNAGSLAYSSSKAALHTMTHVMALEFGEYKIRVNAIAPAIFGSEITKGLYETKWGRCVSDKIMPIANFHDATLDPSFTELVRYWINSSSKYVTGNIFVVDAGYTNTGVPIWSSL